MNDETAMAGLRRANVADIPGVTALQRAAYAGNRSILGVESLEDRRLIHLVKYVE